MKRIYLLASLLFFLVSCNGIEQSVSDIASTESSGATVNMQGEDYVSQIWKKFLKNQTFQQCIANATDMCIDQVKMDSSLAWSGANTLSVSCDDYVLDSNKENCKMQEVLASARDSGDVSACNSLSDTAKERCKFEVVISQITDSSEVSVCDVLENSYALNCKSRIVFTQAVKKKDATVCDTLLNQTTGTGADELMNAQINVDMCKSDVETEIQISEMNVESVSQ